ncbi:protein RALF-like 32 [Mercurialis annua]|uniref:protein RALF-like 32 n=1 Tax=Mercurialis annua TaxID=3986 RepID=UPI002160D7BE|nr:protein RALF-like 32 [Mercurialis annua]
MEHKCSFLFVLAVILMFSFLHEPKTVSSSSSSACNGSIAECYAEEYEMLMESEISRRFLEEKKYISPGALKRDQPVCKSGANGQSYSSSCLPPSSNPHSRGCSKYYRCRSDS